MASSFGGFISNYSQANVISKIPISSMKQLNTRFYSRYFTGGSSNRFSMSPHQYYRNLSAKIKKSVTRKPCRLNYLAISKQSTVDTQSVIKGSDLDDVHDISTYKFKPNIVFFEDFSHYQNSFAPAELITTSDCNGEFLFSSDHFQDAADINLNCWQCIIVAIKSKLAFLST